MNLINSEFTVSNHVDDLVSQEECSILIFIWKYYTTPFVPKAMPIIGQYIVVEILIFLIKKDQMYSICH